MSSRPNESAVSLSRLRVQDFLSSLQNLYGKSQILIRAGDLAGSRICEHACATRLIGQHSGRLELLFAVAFGNTEGGKYNILVQSNHNAPDWAWLGKRAAELRTDVNTIVDSSIRGITSVDAVSAIQSDAPDSIFSETMHVPVGLSAIYGPGAVDTRTLYANILQPVGNEGFVGRYVVERPTVDLGKDVQFNDTIVLNGGGIDVPADSVGKASRRVGVMVIRPGGKKYYRFLDGPVLAEFERWKVNAFQIEDEE